MVTMPGWERTPARPGGSPPRGSPAIGRWGRRPGGGEAGRAGFAEQPLAQAGALLGVGDFAEADGFDGDRTADGGIGGQVNDTHGAAAQLAHDLVASDAVHQTYSVLCRGRRGHGRGRVATVLGDF